MNKKILIPLLLVAALGAGFFIYTRVNNLDKQDRTLTQEEIDKMNAEDTTPPSEKNASDQEQNNTGTTTPPASTTTKKSATVSISQAGPGSGSEENLVVVRAFANVFEDGKCTATFTKDGSAPQTYTVNTEQQPQYTQCDPFQIPKGEFASGTWKVFVTFESPNYKGTSEARQFSL